MYVFFLLKKYSELVPSHSLAISKHIFYKVDMNIKAKKSLGQNFLKDDAILQQIIENAELSTDDIAIEIGPGHGVLTELLAKKCKKVIAIELDDRLIEVLQNKFNNVNNVEIIHGDILKIN